MKHLVFVFFFFLPSLIISQTELSGVINNYLEVEAIDTCNARLSVNNTEGFEAGMDVLLIQMKGATINESNNSSFGNIENIGHAGKYELAKIKSIDDNDIFLENKLVNKYSLSGFVQLVSVPHFENAIVTDTLLPEKWNGSKGGILALKVDNTLTLQESILANGSGFRGGRSNESEDNNCNWLIPHFNYYYNYGNWRAAEKGEGIAAYIDGRESGRGPQANGGGGGNDTNAGGGGGSNTSNGGNGGQNNEPQLLGCKGNYPGLGGKSLTADLDRIYLGGGGGGGHGNNTLGTNGGRGGGIIIIIANEITGNGFVISANGKTALKGFNDGPGGGGAGGTILLKANTTDENLSIQAKGGHGGDADQFDWRCYGPGGGGSGGRILLPEGLVINSDISKGNRGTILSSTECAGEANGATNGVAGLQQTLENIPEGMIAIAETAISMQPSTQIACQDELITMSLEAEGNDLEYQWQINTGSGFENIMEGTPYSGTQTSTLTISDPSIEMQGHAYRCIVFNDCFGEVISEEAMIVVQTAPTANFSYSNVDPFTYQFTNLSENGTIYTWDFGDDEGSNEQNPSHVFTEDGEYTVTLTVTNECGSVSFFQTIFIISQPVADFSNSQEGAPCTPFSTTFYSTFSENATSFSWYFPGGEPETSNQEQVDVVYFQEGIYSVTLIVGNSAGSDTITKENFLTVLGTPTIYFEYEVNNDLSVNFINLSASASYIWDFGDNQTSNENAPIHTYSEEGTYEVTLSGSNECGNESYSLSIPVFLSLNASFTIDIEEGCAPLNVQLDNQSQGNVESFLWLFPGGDPLASMDENPSVSYAEPGLYSISLIVENADEKDTLLLEDVITVSAPPIPSFTTDREDFTLSFINTSNWADSYLWDFGDNTTSTDPNPIHTYPSEGIYSVTLTATNECGSISYSQEVGIGSPPMAFFTSDKGSGCSPLTIEFLDLSSDNVTEWLWNFPGGSPEVSNLQNPTVTYAEAGSYDVTLTVSSVLGSNSFLFEDYISVQSSPDADFSFEVDGTTVQFMNTSENAFSFGWNFGDGASSIETNPVHQFPGSGEYLVTLSALNASCGSGVTQTVNITITGSMEAELQKIKVYPIPARNSLIIETNATLTDEALLRLVDSNGRRLIETDWNQNIQKIDIQLLPNGIYWLQNINGRDFRVIKVVVSR